MDRSPLSDVFRFIERAGIVGRSGKKVSGLLAAAPAIGCALPVLALLAFCSAMNDEATAPPATQIIKAKFQGFTVPGNANDAKAAGFRDCGSDYYAATCIKHDASLYGLITDAHVRMDLTDGKMPNDLSALNYDEIEFDFPFGEYSYCAASECQNDSPTSELEQRLKADGWKSWEWRSYRYFVHPNYPLEIAIRIGTQRKGESGVSMRFEEAENVQARIEKLAKEQTEVEARASGAAKFKAEMR